MKFLAKTLFLLLFFTKISSAAISDWQYSPNKEAQIRILTSTYQDGDRKSLILGVHFKISDGWHIYGSDFSESGIGVPPNVDFKGSNNYKSYQIFWPKAIEKSEKIGANTLKYSIYEDEIILPIEIFPKNPNEKITLKIKIDYGLCKEICIPATNEFTFDFTATEDKKSLDLIQKFFDKKISKNYDTVTAINYNLFFALIAAFIGGFILNFMPCVLPVLSVKLMTMIKRDNVSLESARLAFSSTIIGTISCFLIFAFFAIFLKISGNIFNWGLQFQNPYFLSLLLIVLLIFISNILGFFEINFSQFIANFLNKKIENKNQNIFLKNFLSGILSVLLATPCSAPFVGSAISFALTQNSAVILLIFTAMSLGFSLPYFILIASPKIIYLLPKPGKWMLQIKNLMAILLAATAIWIIYVLANNIGTYGEIIAILVSMFFILSFKIKNKSLSLFCTILSVIIILILPSAFHNKQKIPDKIDKLWINFDEKNLQTLIQQGKIVIIDVTADWCLTCKFNKLRVFHDEEIVNKLRSDNIVAMRADITKPNEEVMKFIHKHGRYAIPFDVVYSLRAKNGLLASELLTKKELLELINKATK